MTRRRFAAVALAVLLALGFLAVRHAFDIVPVRPWQCDSLDPDKNWFLWWWYGCGDPAAGGGSSGAS